MMTSQQQAQMRTQGRTRNRYGHLRSSLALLCLLLFSTLVHAQQTAKSVEGKVLASNAAPLPGAIIYLQDEKTNVIRTLIATDNGGYRFTQLPADTDYQIWAEYKGKKSKVRLVSSFDTKRDVTFDFHISDK
jgi:hypothetical protein